MIKIQYINMKKILKYVPFVLAGTLISCGSSTEATKQVQNADTTVTVEATKVFKESVEQINSFTATVEAKTVNNISPNMNIRISKINVEVGDHVRKGQTLVVMDLANLEQRRYQMVNDSLEFERIDELYKVGGVSKSDRDKMKLAFDISKTTFNNLNENTRLLSPIDGIVTARNYDNGDMYKVDPIIVIEQIKPVKLMVNVSEALFKDIKTGMLVDITLDVYGEEKFLGKVVLIHPTVNSQTHTFQAEINIENQDERVRPGMFARVSMVSSVQNHVVVPDQSIQKLTGSGDRYVYVEEEGRAVIKKVVLGRRMGNRYEIMSGLEDGDIVITTAQNRLQNGKQVNVKLTEN